MKWYQAHLRVMSRLFELGIFDEVNSCYRKYCIEGSISDFESFKSLVLEDNDIKLYCDELNPNNLDKNDLDSSDVVAYYYQAIACFAMVKALTMLSGSKLKEIDIYEDMPVKAYNVLFEKNGASKDDVLINALQKQDFTSSPKDFLSKFLRFNHDSFLSGRHLLVPEVYEFSANNKSKYLTSKAAHEAISWRNSDAFRNLKANKNLQNEADKKASTAIEGNYFNIDSSLDSGLQVLKAIDLLGMHLLLVAQRRQYMFERFRCDDLRSNYKVLAKVKSDDIVRLHNNALAACLAFEEALKGLRSNASDFNICNVLVKDIVGRNDALYQYICYFVQLFEALQVSDYCTNLANRWEVEYYYFNLYEAFKQLSRLQSKLLIIVDDLLRTDGALAKCLDNHLSNEQEMVNSLLGSIPLNVFDICAHFAPSFDNANLSHPSLVDFKAIVNSVMAYSQSLNQAAPTLSYPIKKDSEYDVNDCGEIIWFKRRNRDRHYYIETINENLAFDVIADPKPIVFSRKLNIYFEMFCLISDLVETYNNYYLRTIYNANDEFKSGSKLSFAFDLSYCSEDLVNTIYPTYELLLKDETFIKLIECHQACFEHLVLILDLQGETHLLYEDSYMSNLLLKTNNFDQEFADSLALNKKASNGSNRPTLSKAEQLLLNKTCISYLQDCQKLGQLSKEFVENTSELDKFLNEKLEEFISAKIQTFSHMQNLCLNPINAFSQYIISNLENVPDDLKLSVAGTSNNDRLNNEVGIELTQNFYKCVSETLLVFLAKNMNLFNKEIIPYTKLATKEGFAKSLNSVCLVETLGIGFKSPHHHVLVAYKRLLQSYNYDTFISKHICYNPLFINSALIWILSKYAYSLNLTILPIVKRFVRIVLSFIRMSEINEYQDYLNMIYNLVQKLTKLFSTNPAKIRNLQSLVEQGNVVLCERFEYKSYLSEIVDGFSLFEGLWRKFNSTYSDLNHIYDACQISGFRALYKDLLEDAPRVLKCIDVNFYKNLGTQLHNATPYFNAQDYVSINSVYINEAIKSGGARLLRPQLLAVEHFFGAEIASMIKGEDDNFYGSEMVGCSPFLWSRHHPREKGLTKNDMRVINVVMEKLRMFDDEELHQLLNLESQKMATQIVDSSTDTATSKSKAKATTAKSKATTTKSKAAAAAKSKAQKAATKDAANANVISDPLDAIEAEAEAEAKPKANSTRSKAKKAEVASEPNLNAKSTTKATATKGRAKKVATTSSNEATATANSAKVTEVEPKKKATRAKKASTATATAKATAGKDVSAQARAEVELEADAKPKANAKTNGAAKSTTKATATKGRAKKVAAVDSTEANSNAKAEEDVGAAPKKKAATARATNKTSSSTRAKKSTAKS